MDYSWSATESPLVYKALPLQYDDAHCCAKGVKFPLTKPGWTAFPVADVRLRPSLDIRSPGLCGTILNWCKFILIQEKMKLYTLNVNFLNLQKCL